MISYYFGIIKGYAEEQEHALYIKSYSTCEIPLPGSVANA